MPKKTQPSRLTAGSHQPAPPRGGPPAMARRRAVGDRARDEEADRASPVRPPDELVVAGIGQGRVHRLVGRDVEEERARRLDDRGPPARPAAGGVPARPGEPALQPAAGGEQDRADEEGDRVGRRSDELHVARERADEEARRPEREADRHPPFTAHNRYSTPHSRPRDRSIRVRTPRPPSVTLARTPTKGSRTMTLTHPRTNHKSHEDLAVQPLFGLEGTTIPRDAIPESELSPDVAYQIIHDELMLDGNARLNVATFVTTWMEPQAQQLMTECFDKNMIDKDEYPQTAEIEARCVKMLSALWHAPEAAEATGCSTTGSSEAAMLGGLAFKRLWMQRRQAEGKPVDKPNLVMGINVQVCWEKFANYWDVEMRLVPMEGDRFNMSAEEAVKLCDENTIGVVAILGSTFDGSFEPVKEICDALDAFEKETGINVPVHVDGASGAMIAPFLDSELEWDFRLPRVASINVSGHKYGLVYPGVGWVVWRDVDALPPDLIFWVNYLGDNMPTFALNFSRPGAQVVAQYYNFLRLGFDGYKAVQGYARDVATRLSGQIEELGPFQLLTRGDELPVFAFTTKAEVDNFTVFDVSNAMRERGWQVPAYTFPENRTDIAALRVVVRRGFTHDLADMLGADLQKQLPRLEKQPAQVHD